MKLALLITILNYLSLGTAFAEESCRQLIEINKSPIYDSYTIDGPSGKPIEILKAKNGKRLRATQLFPELDPQKYVLIGFTPGGHTYLIYKNYRIDSAGAGGFLVNSTIHKSNLIYGDTVVALYDLNDSTLTRLDNAISEYKTKFDLTCVHLTCRFLNFKEDDHFRKFYVPHNLLKYFMKLKENGEKVKIVSFTDIPIHDTIENYKLSVNVQVVTHAAYFGPVILAGVIGALNNLVP